MGLTPELNSFSFLRKSSEDLPSFSSIAAYLLFVVICGLGLSLAYIK